MRNALRHGGAHRVRVAVVFATDHLTVTVTDDGGGFDADRPSGDARSTHLGLLGMGERARLLGGELDIRSVPGRGTEIEATIPTSARTVGSG